VTDVLAMLERADIAHRTVSHPPVRTVEEARAHWADIDAQHTKNLLLKDAGNRLWLVSMPAEKPLDLKALPDRIGSKRLRFASPDQLHDVLRIAPGAVSPLAIVNDRERQVTLVLDAELLAAPAIAFHPLDNTRTTVLAPSDFKRFLDQLGREPLVVPL
jgi:Ala-tRNA(Pro) deacylase